MVVGDAVDLPPWCEVRETAERGRGVFYKGEKVLEPGTLLFQSLPYAYVLQHLRWAVNCAWCFGSSPKLLQCGRCRTVRYCSSECQREDWKCNHKRECLLLAPFVAKCLKAGILGEDLTDVILLGRFLIRLNKADDENSVTLKNNNDLCCQPKASDARSLSLVENLLKPPEIIPLALSSGLLPKNTQSYEVDIWLRAFQCNNFGITDSIMTPVGAGCYPIGSLLNHECQPNCILVYTPNTHLQVCRALNKIKPGDELCHLYTDVAMPTPERRITLMETYGFFCECKRCVKDPVQTGECLLRQDRWGRQIPALEALQEKPHSTQQQLCASAPSVQDVHQQLLEIRDAIHEKQQQCLEPQDELVHLFEVVKNLEKVVHPLNLDLYTCRCRAFSAALLVKKKEAISLGEHLISFLRAAYKDIPYHPMLALQLHALGDLYEENREFSKAADCFKEALQIYRIAYGPEHSFVTLLETKVPPPST